jgi:purine-binding chemotaxis protein CheW
MSDTATMQLVVFALGDEQYGLPIESVNEIIRYTQPRSIASAEPWISGIIGLRGRIIPIFDLATRLGVARQSDDANGKIVIIETAAGNVGVTVDDVEEVITLGDDQIDDVPGTAGGSVERIAKIEDRLVVLLDPSLFGDGSVPGAVTA